MKEYSLQIAWQHLALTLLILLTIYLGAPLIGLLLIPVWLIAEQTKIKVRKLATPNP